MEKKTMPVSPATLGVLPYEVGQRFKEDLKKSTINMDTINKAKELAKKLTNEKVNKVKKELNIKMKKDRFDDFYKAYNFLSCHPMTDGCYENLAFEISHFYDCLNIEVVKVNPTTNEIDNKDSLNTKTQVWLEFGSWSDKENCPCHDTNLDCGGDTFEEAIIKLANLVAIYYDDISGKPLKLPEAEADVKQYFLKDTDFILTEIFIKDEYGRNIGYRYTVINKLTGKDSNLRELDIYDYDWIEIEEA